MCCAQTYDGAGNMAGKEKGAAANFFSETENEKSRLLSLHITQT